MQITRPFDLHAAQVSEQRGFVIHDACRCWQTAQAPAWVKSLAVTERGLCGGAQQQGDTVVHDQHIQRIEDGLQKLRRQQLGLVEHDHAVCNVVQLAAARRAGGEERLEQLDIGGDDERRFPVFARKPAQRRFVAIGGVGLTVVLDDMVGAEDAAEYIAGLLDDAGVGNSVDHAALAVGLGMLQGEGERRQGLAAAGGHGQREDAGRKQRLLATLAKNVGARKHHRLKGTALIDYLSALRRQVFIQPSQVVVQRRHASTAVCLAFIHEPFGVEKIGIDQRREQHANPHRNRQRLIGLRPRNGSKRTLKVEAGRQLQKLGGRRLARGKSFFVLAFAIGGARAKQTRPNPCDPIAQARVMAGDDVGEHPAQHAPLHAPSRLGHAQGMQCTGSRVGLVAAAGELALDVRIVDGADVALKAWPVLPQVVPQPCKVSPLR